MGEIADDLNAQMFDNMGVDDEDFDEFGLFSEFMNGD